MKKLKKIVSLAEYLAKLDDDAKAAELFSNDFVRVKARAVAGWRRLERVPAPLTAIWIVKVAGGALTLESIYGKFDNSLLTDRNVPRRARKKKVVLRGNV